MAGIVMIYEIDHGLAHHHSDDDSRGAQQRGEAHVDAR
jgi:hypothetical protein